LNMVLERVGWQTLSEAQICERIISEKPDFKRIVGSLPAEVGLTRAVVAAALEAGCVADKDLIVLTPTLEELGLLELDFIQERWKAAVGKVDDQRAANIAKKVKAKPAAAALEAASEKAAAATVVEATRGLRIYVMVDISGSMQGAIEKAKEYLAKLLVVFPLDKLHVAVFNTQGREVLIKHASAAGVSHAFASFRAAGGTDYGAGVRVLSKYKPKPEEDSLFIFTGDQQAGWFTEAVRASGLNPVAFGFVPVGETTVANAVTGTAYDLKIPCFTLEDAHFADAYALPRTLKTLMQAAPVSAKPAAQTQRTPLVDQILQAELLTLPAWARG
jgi:hypothetical protein